MNIKAYFDNNASTRLADEALSAMLPFLQDDYINPSSIAGEIFGSGRAIGDASRELALLFGSIDLSDRFQITSGASESNSWAVKAALEVAGSRHAVATRIEHPSLLAALEAQARRGAYVDLVDPEPNGRVDVERFIASVRPDTLLISVMAANNETGVLQPIAEIASAARAVAPNALIHVDATQAVGRVPLDLTMDLAEVDLLSLSAHKFHGPKGVGALFVREGRRLEPLIHGGGRSRGGTPNPAGAAGLAAAAHLARSSIGDVERLRSLRDLFERLLAERIPTVFFNGSSAARLYNTSSIGIPGLDAQSAVEELACRGICVASGAACSSGSLSPSHVLVAMGLSYEQARSTIRVSISRLTTMAEILTLIDALVDMAGSI